MAEMRKSVDRATFEVRVTALKAQVAPYLHEKTRRGAQSRMITAVVPVFLEAFCVEVEGSTDDDNNMTYSAVVSVVANILATVTRSFDAGMPEEMLLATLLTDVHAGVMRRLVDPSAMSRVDVQDAGSA